MAMRGSCTHAQCACARFVMAAAATAATESKIATCSRCNHPRDAHTTVTSANRFDRSSADFERSNPSGGGLLYNMYNSIYSYIVRSI